MWSYLRGERLSGEGATMAHTRIDIQNWMLYLRDDWKHIVNEHGNIKCFNLWPRQGKSPEKMF